MEGTDDVSVEREDPHEWCSEQVVVFLRSLGTDECFQSGTDQVLEVGGDDSVFFGLSVNEFQGVCGHVHTYDHMCEFRQTQQHRCTRDGKDK